MAISAVVVRFMKQTKIGVADQGRDMESTCSRCDQGQKQTHPAR